MLQPFKVSRPYTSAARLVISRSLIFLVMIGIIRSILYIIIEDKIPAIDEESAAQRNWPQKSPFDVRSSDISSPGEGNTSSKGPGTKQGKRFPTVLWSEGSPNHIPSSWTNENTMVDWDTITIRSPVDKEFVPPSGDKRDFTSFVVYAWPCSKLPANCLNYGRKRYRKKCKSPEWRICDGHFNEEGMRISGAVDFRIFCRELEAASAEFKLRQTPSAGAAAVRYVRSWFVNSSTALLPRLLYSQTVPFSSDRSRKVGSDDSVIDWWLMPNLLDSITAIQDLLTEEDKTVIHSWFRDFLKFISRDKVRRLHNRHPANHGPWYDVVYYSLCAWLGDHDAMRAQAPWTKEKLDRMVEADGNMPHETSRRSSVYYYIYTLDSFAVCAALLSRIGEDLWSLSLIHI